MIEIGLPEAREYNRDIVNSSYREKILRSPPSVKNQIEFGPNNNYFNDFIMTDQYALFVSAPPKNRVELIERNKKSGQYFPNLFTINENDQCIFRIMGSSFFIGGGGKIITPYAFYINRDSKIVVNNLNIEIVIDKKILWKYHVPFVIITRFGVDINKYNVGDAIDDTIGLTIRELRRNA